MMFIETTGFSFDNLGFGTALLPPAASSDTAGRDGGVASGVTAQLARRAEAHRAWRERVADRQRALSPQPASVPRLSGLSPDAFLDLVYAARRPVVLEGLAAAWPAVRQWTRDHLVAVVGDAPIHYQGGRATHDDYELLKDRHTRTMPFDRYMADIEGSGPGNDAYITAYNSDANRAAFAPLMRDFDRVPYLRGGDGMMWIGPKGTFTPLHHDLTNNLLVQVMGRKRLHLLPPEDTGRLSNTKHVFSDVHDIEDEDCLRRHPEARELRPIVAEIGPGDALFIPVGWWHQVRSIDFSVMLTYTDFLWPNDAFADFPS